MPEIHGTAAPSFERLSELLSSTLDSGGIESVDDDRSGGQTIRALGVTFWEDDAP